MTLSGPVPGAASEPVREADYVTVHRTVIAAYRKLAGLVRVMDYYQAHQLLDIMDELEIE